MAIYVVNTTSDENDIGATAAMPLGTGLSLREAIVLSNAAAGADTITFASGVGEAFEGGGSITLGGTRLEISSDITIDGDLNDDATPDVTIDANALSGVLYVSSGNSTIDGLHITDGNTSFGGGILVSGATLAVNNSTVDNNAASARSGGIYNQGGYLTLNNTTVSGNSSGDRGGGISQNALATTSLINSTVSGNTAVSSGGGIYIASGSLTLSNSTISGNESAASGGGILNTTGTLTLINSTVSGNSASTNGGGIYDFGGTTTLTNSIVLGNSASGSGPETQESVGGSITNTGGLSIVGGVAPNTVFAAIDAVNGSMVGGLLADNGGPVQTIALLNDPSNTALDAGNDASAPATDARSVARFDVSGVANNVANISDLGAFELAPEAPSLVVTTTDDVVDAFDGETSLREAIALANDVTAGDLADGDADNDGNANDTITFDSDLSGGTVVLGGTQLTITSDVTIDGDIDDNATPDITIDGDGTSRVLEITSGVSALNHLILTRGDAILGAGLANTGGTVTLTSSTVSGNYASSRGGGLYNATGMVTLVNSTVSENGANIYGGGITSSAGTVTLINSTVSGNSANNYGGGISITFGTATLSNSTVSGNYSGIDGGGLENVSGTISLVNSILLGNFSAGPGNEYIGTYTDDGLSIIGGTAGAPVAADIFAAIDGITGGGLLADNGGPVQTIALLDSATNLALDAGDDAGAPATDARGLARSDFAGAANNGSNISDLGAYELININDAPTVALDISSLSTLTATFKDQSTIGTFSRNIGGVVRADNFTLSDPLLISDITAYLADSLGSPDNGVLDGFDGTLSWAIYEDNGSELPGTLISTGNDASPTLIDTGNNFGGSLDIVAATIDIGGLALAAGDYWIALHEGNWLSPGDGTEVFWLGTTNDTTGIYSATGSPPTNPVYTASSDSYAFSLASTSIRATEGVTIDLKGVIEIDDPDSGAGDITVTISADYGNVAALPGTSGASVVNQGFTSVEITGTLAEIQALLDTDPTSVVQYTTNTDDPPSSANLSVTINDNGNTGDDGAKQASVGVVIAIQPVNDAPSGTDNTVTIDEDTPYAFTVADFTFSDPENDALESVVISTLPANGALLLNGVPVTALDEISQTDIGNGLLTFTPDLNENGTGYTSFTFQVRDDGGTSNGGIDLDSTPDTMTIDVTDVNDPPIVTLSQATPLTIWDQSLTGGTALGISSAIAAENFTLDFSVTLDLFTAYIVDGAGNDNGVLDNFDGTFGWAIYQDDGAGEPGAFVISGNDSSPVLTDTGATLFGADDVIQADIDLGDVMLPAGDYWIALREGTWLSPVDVTSLGWVSAALDPLPEFAGLTGNLASPDGTFSPTLFRLAYSLDSTPVLAATEQIALDLKDTIQIDDVDVGSGDITVTVAVDYGILNITPGASGAVVADSGTSSVTITGTVSEIQTMLDSGGASTVEYLANTDDPPGSAQLTVTANDNGNTGTGGAMMDSAAVAIIITAVNDAPSGTDGTVTTDEDLAYVFTVADFGFTDPDGGDMLSGVVITTLPALGTLQLGGVPVSALDLIDAADITNGLLTFLPASNDNGPAYASFTFQVVDDSAAPNDTDTTPNTLTIDVTPVNDDPLLGDDAFDAIEDTALLIPAADLLANDADLDGDPLTIASVGNAINGMVALNGQTVVFTPGPGFTGMASFIYSVSDGAGGGDGAVVQIDVLPAASVEPPVVGNEPPVVSPGEVTILTLGDTAISQLVSAFDADGDPLSYVVSDDADNGDVTGGAGGLFTYTPDSGFLGSDSFIVTVSDGQGGSDEQVVTVEVIELPTMLDWQLIATPGFAGEIGGTGRVFGSAGFEDITVLDLPGAVFFDGSFNAGSNNIVRLDGDAADWNVTLDGSAALFNDGDTLISIPAGPSGLDLVFDDGTLELIINGNMQIGGQAITGDFVPVEAAPGGGTLPTGADPAADAILLLFPGAQATAGGNIVVFGTNGAEQIDATVGDLVFDGSFNGGGDVIGTDLAANDFVASLNGSNVILSASELSLTIPVGPAGTTLAFADGNATLIFDTDAQGVFIDDQHITANAAPLSFA